ncbi:MAG: hypothetical protein JNK37_05185 [Verrucomicrobiales bacterium]|nr:hypothetical protein [Verrucomicrobiales bacterium]
MRDHLALAVLWLACFLILWRQGELRSAIRFLCRIWLPLAGGLAIVWGMIVRGTPENPDAHGIPIGLEYAAMISLRIAALASVFQAALLSLRGFQRVRYWSRMGLPPSAVAGVVSIFDLWPDFVRRVDQVVAARCARGLMTDRKLITRVRQIPFAFRTLFLSSLDISMDRAVRWQSERLPERLVETAAASRGGFGSISGSVVWLTLALCWITFAFRHHLLPNP